VVIIFPLLDRRSLRSLASDVIHMPACSGTAQLDLCCKLVMSVCSRSVWADNASALCSDGTQTDPRTHHNGLAVIQRFYRGFKRLVEQALTDCKPHGLITCSGSDIKQPVTRASFM